MAKSGKIHDHTKSGQLCRRGRNRIKTELMMMTSSDIKITITLSRATFVAVLPILKILNHFMLLC